MLKRIFSIFFTIFLIFTVFLTPLSVSAYEVTGIDITAKAGLLVSMDTGIFFTKTILMKRFTLPPLLK